MQLYKVSKSNILKRIDKLDKVTTQSKYANLILITRAKDGWNIQEQYYKPNRTCERKELLCKDYKEYLKTANVNDDTVVIVNDLVSNDSI